MMYLTEPLDAKHQRDSFSCGKNLLDNYFWTQAKQDVKRKLSACFVLLDKNSVFVSKNHANRYQSNEYVYNGLDWDDYGKVDLEKKRKRFHFLGNAAWRSEFRGRLHAY